MDFALTPRYLFAQKHLNQDLADFVKSGLIDAPADLAVALSRLESYAAAAVLENLDRAGFRSDYTFKEKKAKDAKESTESDVALVYGQYVKFLKTHCIYSIAKSVPTECRNLSDAENQRIWLEYGMADRPAASIDADNPVAVAWRLARENQVRATQRVGAVYFLASQLQRGGLSSTEREFLEKGNQSIVTYLNNQARSFAHDEMMFAIVLGGSALAVTRQRLFEEDLNPRYNVVQYLQTDRNMPGRYHGSVEDGFRAKLQEYRDNP